MEFKNRVPNPTPRAIAKKRRELMSSIFLGVVILAVVALTVAVFHYR